MNTIRIALYECFSVGREQALVIPNLHPSTVIRVIERHLPKFDHLKRLVQILDDCLNENKPIKVLVCASLVCGFFKLLLPGISTYAWPVHA